MRLLCTLKDINTGRNFSTFLQEQNIPSKCEIITTPESTFCRIWIENEDQAPDAQEWLNILKENPASPLFRKTHKTSEPIGVINWISLILCGVLFLATQLTTPPREAVPSQFPALSPVKKELLYDYPPYWTGLYDKAADYLTGQPVLFNAPLFEKIRQGEVWRLFTPALLHIDILHIAFNMLWVIILGKQIEKRLGTARYLLFILVAGIFSNTAQYLMSGPNFAGFSGIVCAMIMFVWIRQKIAPWEGYLMQPSTFNFVVFFVFLMFALQTLSFILEITIQKAIPVSIANTAHLAGGLIGYLMGRLNFFSR